MRARWFFCISLSKQKERLRPNYVAAVANHIRKLGHISVRLLIMGENVSLVTTT